MRPPATIPIARYLTLRRRLAQVGLYIGLALLFSLLQLLIWLDISITFIGVGLAIALFIEVVAYAELHKHLFGRRFAPCCAICGGIMIVDERDKDNEVGTTKYYAELDETDEVFECLDCKSTWRNLPRR